MRKMISFLAGVLAGALIGSVAALVARSRVWWRASRNASVFGDRD